MKRFWVGAFLFGLLITGTLFVPWEVAKLRAAQAPNGLRNFGYVTDNLYRGAQPPGEGFNTLKSMGVEIVVNFRDGSAQSAAEKREVESLGMQYVSIPWSGVQYPSNSQVVEFLDLVRSNPQSKIFVHCERGADRTGTMIAAYRIAVEHKSVPDTISEMRRFHYDYILLPQLQRYVISLPTLLRHNPAFSAYAPPSAQTPGTAAVARETVPVSASH